MMPRKRFVILSFVLLFAFSLGQPLYKSEKAAAVTAGEWRAGRIIDDGLFTDRAAMSAEQIQNFLNAKVGTGGYGRIAGQCDTNGVGTSEFGGGTRAQFGASRNNPAPFTCLKDYYEVPKTAPGPGVPASNYGGAPIPAGARSAAQLIWDAAQRYNISPKVLLVTIQKESAGPLTTDDWPFRAQYTYAMGAYCPDSGPGGSANCDPNYAGFSIQISESAALFRWYLDNMEQPWWSYKRPGNNSIQYNPNTSCGSSNVYIENKATAALYTYTPYQPNQSALNNLYGSGDSCGAYGNRNFWRIYNDWFGSTTLPTVFKGTGSGTVYALIGGYKIAIPSMAILQDYGFDPGAIQTLNQNTVDATPSPPTAANLSNQLSYLVKSNNDQDADGGAVYVVSVGKKYPLVSMDQFNAFGFNASQISYLPLNYIQSLPGSLPLSNFITTPYGSVFSVSSAAKRIIFDYNKYKQLNPSDHHSLVSSSFVNTLPSGLPLSDRDILVRSSLGTIYLFNNNSYYSLASMNIYNCWGFGAALDTPLYGLADDSHIGPVSPAAALECLTKDSQNAVSLLNRTNKYTVPAGYGLAPSTPTATDLLTISSRIPTSTSSLKQYAKASNSAAIWFLQNGSKSLVPSMSNYNLLGLNSSLITSLDASAINTLPASGIKLGSGQVVKTSESGAVYVVSGNTRLLLSNGDDFDAYRLSWSNIETYTSTSLDQFYPLSGTINKYLLDVSSNAYLVDKNGCYQLTSSQLTSYGQNLAALSSSQQYSANIFTNLSLASCTQASTYVKQPSTNTVYWVDDGKRYPFSSWSSLTTHSNSSSPYIINLSGSTLQTYPSQPAI